MTGQAERVSPPSGGATDGLRAVPARFLRPGRDLTVLTFRRSATVRGGLTQRVRKLTHLARPNLPWTQHGGLL